MISQGMDHPHILKVSRLEGLTDGIFAIAMTILALDLHLPPHIQHTNLTILLTQDILVKLFVYAGSFIILGTLWIAMNFQLGLLERINRPYLWTHIFYLMVVCVVPFSASLVAAYPNDAVSIRFFAINLLCASVGQLLISQSAYAHGLNKEIYTPQIRRTILQRIFVAPLFYISALLLAPYSPILAFGMLIAPILIYMRSGRVDKYDIGSA